MKPFRFGIDKETFYRDYCLFCMELTKKEECPGHSFTTPTSNRFQDTKQFVHEAWFETLTPGNVNG